MKNAQKLAIQKISFIEELHKSIQLIEGGFQILQSSNGVNFHRFTVLRLLSDGLERYLKLIIQAHTYNNTGCFCSEKQMRSFGHNIEGLSNYVLDNCFSKTTTRSCVSQDLSFVANDAILKTFIPLLSDFGKSLRYYHLDSVADPEKYSEESPEEKWDDVLYAALPQGIHDPRLSQPNEDFSDGVSVVIGSLERYLRCLARSLFFDDAMQNEVKSFATHMLVFLRLEDADFGKRQYPYFSIS